MTNAEIRRVANSIRADFERDGAPPIFDAIADAVDGAELRALAMALCARYQATTGELGASDGDPRMNVLAEAVGYNARFFGA